MSKENGALIDVVVRKNRGGGGGNGGNSNSSSKQSSPRLAAASGTSHSSFFQRLRRGGGEDGCMMAKWTTRPMQLLYIVTVIILLSLTLVMRTDTVADAHGSGGDSGGADAVMAASKQSLSASIKAMHAGLAKGVHHGTGISTAATRTAATRISSPSDATSNIDYSTTNLAIPAVFDAARQKTCLEQRSKLLWKPDYKPNTRDVWKIMATVMFASRPQGIAARCDWVLGNRFTLYKVAKPNTMWGDPAADNVETIFVRTDLLQPFYMQVMPCLVRPFVLITGDNDVSIPRQLDKRYEKFLHPQIWQRILADPRIKHHFAEHLDTQPTTPTLMYRAVSDGSARVAQFESKVTAFPLGINPAEFQFSGQPNADFILDHIPTAAAVAKAYDSRPLTMLQCDRERDGGTRQWMDRHVVLQLCKVGAWSAFCHTKSSKPGKPFFKMLQEQTFTLCVHGGGGGDPSPKAWEVLLMGGIPIIQHWAGDAPYRHLPVVFVDDWNPTQVTPELLAKWRQALRPWFVDPRKRAEVVRRLHAAYWWDHVETAVRGEPQPIVDDISIEWRPGPPEEHEDNWDRNPNGQLNKWPSYAPHTR